MLPLFFVKKSGKLSQKKHWDNASERRRIKERLDTKEKCKQGKLVTRHTPVVCVSLTLLPSSSPAKDVGLSTPAFLG